MAQVYFKVLISDLTQNILDRSTTNDPYKTNRTTDGNYIMISFEEDSIPVELFQKQYTPLTNSEARAELDTSDWDAEVEPNLNYNTEEDFPLVANAFSFTATANSTTEHDFKFTDNFLFRNAAFISSNANNGDSIKVEIVDVDNILGLGADTIIRTPIEKGFVQSTSNSGPILVTNVFKRELLRKNLYLRIHYTNTDPSNDVDVYINLTLYKRV